MENVRWASGAVFKANAQDVYAEVGDVSITPQEVLEKARNNPGGELHKCFTWDDSEAAEKYRIVEAQKILRSLVIIPVRKEDAPVRVFSITSERHVYMPTRQFITNVDEHQNLLRRALLELDAFKRKYKTLTELTEIFTAIDEAIEN